MKLYASDRLLGSTVSPEMKEHVLKELTDWGKKIARLANRQNYSLENHDRAKWYEDHLDDARLCYSRAKRATSTEELDHVLTLAMKMFSIGGEASTLRHLRDYVRGKQ